MTRRPHFFGPLRRAVALSILLLSGTGSVLGQSTAVTASGSGSVAVGTMSGGSIQIGLTEAQVREMMNATGKQRDELLRKFVADLNRQTERAAFTEGAVTQFLSALTRRQVPPGEWPQALGEITRRYLELEARMVAIPVTSDRIKALVDLAEAARVAGRFDEADTLLGEAALAAIEDARRLKDQARTASRQAASILVSQASLALTRYDRSKGTRLLVEAFEQRAGDVDSATLWWLIEAGDAAMADGRSDWALQIYRRAQVTAQEWVLIAPSNADWMLQLLISHERIGNVQFIQGNWDGALTSYQKRLAIVEQLLEQDMSNGSLYRDLSISYEKIGDIQIAQGNSKNALENYQSSMEFRLILAKINPQNNILQRDLGISYEKIGEILLDQENAGGALEFFKKSMRISKNLTEQDPSNGIWQDDLAVDYEKIGDTQIKQGNLNEALVSYEHSLEIHTKLLRLDSTNTKWQSKISINYNKIGDAQIMQGDLEGALASYKSSMQMRLRLAEKDPSNVEWQIALARSYWKMGEIDMPALSKAERRTWLAHGLAVLKQLDQAGRLAPNRREWIGIFENALRTLD